MSDWVRATLPEIEVGEDCVQRAGEAIYIPAGWLHATLTLGETTGVGGQAHWPAAARRDAANAVLTDAEARECGNGLHALDAARSCLIVAADRPEFGHRDPAIRGGREEAGSKPL